MLIDAVYVKKGSPAILVQVATVLAPYDDDLSTYLPGDSFTDAAS